MEKKLNFYDIKSLLKEFKKLTEEYQRPVSLIADIQDISDRLFWSLMSLHDVSKTQQR